MDRVTRLPQFPTLILLLGLLCLALPACGRIVEVDMSPVSDAASADSSPDADDDMDGVINRDDNCMYIANPGQENSDNDSRGDACDNCPARDNEDQADMVDGGDGTGDACDDEDQDGIVDAADNCWNVANPDQENSDTDNLGDACDNCPLDINNDQADSDSDNLGDICDNCPLVANPGQSDADSDTVGDACDNCPTVNNPRQQNLLDSDTVGDACDPRPAEDGDSIAFFDGFDTDSPNGPPPGWTVAIGPGNAAGTWYASEGELRQSVGGNTDPTILYRNDLVPLGNVLIEVKATAGTINGSNTSYIGVAAAYADGPEGPDNGFSCVTQQTGTDATLIRIFEWLLGGAAGDTAPLEFTMTNGETYRIHQYQYNDGVANRTVCQALDATSTGHSFARSFPGLATGAVGMVTKQMAASFDSILVYSLGGPIACTPPARCF